MRRVTWLAVLVPVALLTAWPALAKSPIDDAALDRTTAAGEQEPDPKAKESAAAYTDPRVNYTGRESVARAAELLQRPPLTPPGTINFHEVFTGIPGLR